MATGKEGRMAGTRRLIGHIVTTVRKQRVNRKPGLAIKHQGLFPMTH